MGAEERTARFARVARAFGHQLPPNKDAGVIDVTAEEADEESEDGDTCGAVHETGEMGLSVEPAGLADRCGSELRLDRG